MTARIVYLDRASIRAEVRRPVMPHQWVEYENTTSEQRLERLQGASIAIANKVAIDASLMDALPDLRFIAVAATGTNNIDLAAAKARSIAVSNIRAYAVKTVPEHALAMIFALSRNLFAYRSAVAAGEWQSSSQFCLFHYPIRDLSEMSLGIIGKGSLGSGLARLASALGMRVSFAEHRQAEKVREGYAAFESVLKNSDVISLHCPLTDATRNLLGARELAMMKPGALLINTARGGLVDESALAEALRSGRLGGAGFDVLSEEPPVDGNVLLDPALLASPNFLLTPHCAWASQPAMQALADQLIDNIDAFMAGAPQNLVV